MNSFVKKRFARWECNYTGISTMEDSLKHCLLALHRGLMWRWISFRKLENNFHIWEGTTNEVKEKAAFPREFPWSFCNEIIMITGAIELFVLISNSLVSFLREIINRPKLETLLGWIKFRLASLIFFLERNSSKNDSILFEDLFRNEIEKKFLSRD